MLYLLIIVLGLILGSFLNSWMWRVEQVSLRGKIGTRSVCVACHRQLAWYENIPLASFIALGGKCRTCQAKIPLDYFLVELATPILLAGVVYFNLNFRNFNQWIFFRDIFFAAILMVIFVYDWKYKIILSGVVWSGAVVGVVLQLAPLIHNSKFLIQASELLVIGGLAGFGFFLIQYLVSHGRWVGGGDVRMGAMMGLWLGWPNILVALFCAYILGALVAVPLLVFKKKNMNSEIPFGTFLAVGTMVAMFAGSNIIRWYMGIIGS